MSTLGERIKKLRGNHTQAWLARQLSIPPTTLSNYENGKSELSFAMIEAITTIFKLNTDWLLFGRGSMRDGEEAESPVRPDSASSAEACCDRCAKLETKLEYAEEERRELTAHVRKMMVQHSELTAENRQLWKESAELREKCARLEERQYQRSSRGDSETVGHAE